MAHVTTTAETSVEPFTVSVPQAAIDDLKRRLELTRWPERETVADWTQGVPRDSRQRVSAMSPKEIFCPVKAWAEALWPNLFYWNELDRGGHFARIRAARALYRRDAKGV